MVKFEEHIDDYMAREVLPHIPDAVAFFEENLGAKKPVVKTGAEIPFTRYFYKYIPFPTNFLSICTIFHLVNIMLGFKITFHFQS